MPHKPPLQLSRSVVFWLFAGRNYTREVLIIRLSLSHGSSHARLLFWFFLPNNSRITRATEHSWPRLQSLRPLLCLVPSPPSSQLSRIRSIPVFMILFIYLLLSTLHICANFTIQLIMGVFYSTKNYGANFLGNFTNIPIGC